MKSSLNRFGGLKQRVVTALIGAMVVISGTVYDKWTYFVVFLLVSMLTQWEFYHLTRIDSKLPLRVWGTFIGTIFFSLTFLVEAKILEPIYFLVLFPLLTSVFVIKLYKKEDEEPFTNVAYTFLGIIYVAIPFALLNIIAFETGSYSFEIVLGILLIIWASDTGAYFSGISIGRKKLFERVSPKKTWEGSIGGGVLALVMAYVLSLNFYDLNTVQWFVAAGLTVITGIYGDLVESIFKRSIEIKDSGNTLPGHGGFLDRFDSLLVALPFMVVFIKIFS